MRRSLKRWLDERGPLVIAAGGLLLYLLLSAQIAFARWIHTGFCDTAEEDCALPWTANRVLAWALWIALGLTLAASTALAIRPATRRAARLGLLAAALLAVASAVALAALW